MHLQKLLPLLGLTLYAAFPLQAQSIGPSTLDAAGKSASAGGITHEYAIGQLAGGNTFISSSLVVTPGVLQPVSTSGITGHAISSGDLLVYPSPVETTLFLQPAFSGNGTLYYGLYDAAGKLVLSREAVLKSGTERQTMEVERFAAGQYMLQVTWIQAGVSYSSGYKVQKLR